MTPAKWSAWRGSCHGGHAGGHPALPRLPSALACAACLVWGWLRMDHCGAQAAAGRMLYDTSDMERVGGEAATAAMQEGTRRCCACHLRDLLPCLGGVAAVLPLFAQLGAPPACEALHLA